MVDFRDSKISEIITHDGTKIFPGPFEVDGVSYDYKIIDNFGEDFCNLNQLQEWNHEIKKVLYQ